MNGRPVLIVDDEKNIRLTIEQTLTPMGLDIDTAVNGEEALQKVRDKAFQLLLLDLKMPGMDGMEVLRRLSELRPEIKIIVITAHGTVDTAVEAMKLGAVDFIQKPFTPNEIRVLVRGVLDRDALEESKISGYNGHLEWAKKCIQERRFDGAEEHVRKAIAMDTTRAEGFNLLGALIEMHGDIAGAKKNYLAAYALDPTYAPVRANLQRVSHLPGPSGAISLE